MSIFSDHIWIKRWAGSYTFTSCDYWGKQYYSTLKKVLGLGFNYSLFIHQQGVVSFFLRQDEFQKFGKTMAKYTIKNPTQARKRLRELKNNTDLIVLLMKKMRGKLPTVAEYKKFLYYYDRHLPLHNFMKKTVDFLPEEFGTSILPIFKEARVYSERVYSDTEKFFRTIAQVITKQSNYQADNLTCLSQFELEEYLKNKKLPPKKDLVKRYRSSALVFEKGRSTLVLGKSVQKIEQQIFQAISTQKGKLKGVVAYGGEVIGVARIVLDPHRPGKFNKGDILITGMTRPEFIPLIKKASAIITDAGGVLCHAAISAREFKKTCIVGTEIATRALKNGQIIKVDGKNGLISLVK